MRYDYDNYLKLKNTLSIVQKYAFNMYSELLTYEDELKEYFNSEYLLANLDIYATKKIIENKKEIMLESIDLYYDVCKMLSYPTIKSYDDFNPTFSEYCREFPKNFDEGLITLYDRILIRATLEALPENNNRVSVSLDISVTEKELAIKKELIKFGYKHYFDILHSQGIPTILS